MLRAVYSSFFALLLVASILPASSRAQDTLRWKFSQGERFRVRQVHDTELHRIVKNKRLTTQTQMYSEMFWEVSSVENDVAEMTQTFTRIGIKMRSPNAGEIVYDSGDETKPAGSAREIAASVSPLIGAKINIKLNTLGEILSAEMPEETARILHDAGADTRLKNLLSREGIERALRQTLVVLPKEPVQEGETWTAEIDLDSPLGKLQQKTVYTHLGTEELAGREAVKIGYDSTLEIIESEGVKPRLKLNEQKQTGVLYFNPVAGFFPHSEITQTHGGTTAYRDINIKLEAKSTLKMDIDIVE